MTGQDREADLLECTGECFGEPCLVLGVAAQELPEVESRNPIIVVELVPFAFRKPIGVRLSHLIVFLELLIERVDVGHAAVTAAVAASALCSRRPFQAAWAMIAAA